MEDLSNNKIAIVGLGYVGLPLAVEFGKKFSTLGFDINQTRINELIDGNDKTLEVNSSELAEANKLRFSSSVDDLSSYNIIIVTVPTPINDNKQPDLSPLISASEMIGASLKKGDIVIYESTVYPGATEEVCMPILEKKSGLKYNKDFYLGYSPERINPGDKSHRIQNIVKVTSGSNKTTTDLVDNLYSSIIEAGTFKVSSIRIAEAAKVIENTQRDVNIALINELAIIFERLDIDTTEVLEAASSKWNFLPFRPGLVGGHCIGVDPYYLTYKSESVGYHPEIILAGRRINDGMGAFVSSVLIKKMIKESIKINGSKILLMGMTFKENCPDVRNTKIIDIHSELNDFGIDVDCYDPWIDENDGKKELGINLIQQPSKNNYDGIVIAVGHQIFLEMGASEIRKFGKDRHVLFDLKSLFPLSQSDLRL